MPSQPILSTRALNRALLARQMLLAREKVGVVAAVERIAGMQAQVPRPPFMGLWTRLAAFERRDVLLALQKKKLVRATAMRGTIHLLSTRDFLGWRPLLAEMLVRGGDAIAGKTLSGIDKPALYTTGREFFSRAPAPFEDFRAHLEASYPRAQVRAMAYTVRMGVPLIMVPTEAPWGFASNAGFFLADEWLGEEVSGHSDALDVMLRRYLAAFGPATPADFQTWSGIRGARDVFERLRAKLVTFRDERKRELFDLPKAPRPDEDTAAPVRFLAEYDNALLAHDDRSRIVPEQHRKLVYTRNLIIPGTFLVDGFVAGLWTLQRRRKAAVLSLAPFARLPKSAGAELRAEGGKLLAFLEPDASDRDVTIGKTP